jgi:tetratricopeptide (TPR) repeat protein
MTTQILNSALLCTLLFGLGGARAVGAQQVLQMREITGQVRLAGKPAPPGVTVTLRVAFNRELVESDQEEVAHTVTTVGGKFAFRHLENLGDNEGKELYAISAVTQGYRAAQQLADLTEVARGDVLLDLERVTNSLASTRSAPAIVYSGPAKGADGADASNASRRPRNPEAVAAMDRGQELLFRQKKAEASIVEFKKALKLDPWFGPGYVLMGLASMQLQQWDQAQYAFEEAIKVEPGNADAYLGLGSALNEQKSYAAAQKALEQSLQLKPESAEAHYELARTLCSQEKWQAALPHAQRAVAINPDYAGPHALMGNILLQGEDADGALNEFRTYLRLAPDGPLAPKVKEMVDQLEKALGEDDK